MSANHKNLWQRLLLKASSLMPPHSSFTAKVRRIAYGKRFKHMRNIGNQFQLRATDIPQIYDIIWNGRKLGQTATLPKAVKNEDMWLLASGPSINELDLSQLKGRNIMALNGAITSCEKHALTPTFYAITDRDFFENRMTLVEKAVRSGAHCFFSFNGLARICEQAPHLIAIGDISLLETVNRHYETPQLTNSELEQYCAQDNDLYLPHANNPKVGWSHNLSKGVFTANTIAYIGCQIAAHLKTRNAFILGMDLGATGLARSYEAGSAARPTTIDKDYEKTILPAFQLLSEIETFTTFYNLSLNSRLPDSIIPKISMNEALETSSTTQ